MPKTTRIIKPNTFQLEGHISVDSGQVMLIDPCYIKSNFATESGATAGLNYAGACGVTLSKDRCGEFGGLAFATSTYYGDGEYPVFVKRDESGGITEIKIKFKNPK